MLNLQRVGAVFFKQLPAETENRTFKEVIHMYTANAQLLEAFNKEHEYLKTKLDLGREILWLTKDECIQAGPDVEETLELVKGAMIAHGRNEYEMPAKIGIHPYEDVFFHAMPAYVPGNLACGCKWIECYPRNPKDYGLPQTTGLQIMNDIVTGVPIAVMDCTWLTAMRTPAITALAAALHPHARTFGMFGCGVQGIGHVRFAAKALKELEKIYIYDKFPESMDRLIEQVADEVKLPIIKASCPEEVVKNCEVLSSAAFIVREPMKLVRKEWIRKGQTILPCDLNTFWDPRIALTASTLWTASTSTSCLPVWAISPTDCRRSPVRPARYWPVSPRAAPARMRSLCAAISASPPMTSPWDRRSSPRLWKWASAPG